LRPSSRRARNSKGWPQRLGILVEVQLLALVDPERPRARTMINAEVSSTITNRVLHDPGVDLQERYQPVWPTRNVHGARHRGTGPPCKIALAASWMVLPARPDMNGAAHSSTASDTAAAASSPRVPTTITCRACRRAHLRFDVGGACPGSAPRSTRPGRTPNCARSNVPTRTLRRSPSLPSTFMPRRRRRTRRP